MRQSAFVKPWQFWPVDHICKSIQWRIAVTIALLKSVNWGWPFPQSCASCTMRTRVYQDLGRRTWEAVNWGPALGWHSSDYGTEPHTPHWIYICAIVLLLRHHEDTEAQQQRAPCLLLKLLQGSAWERKAGLRPELPRMAWMVRSMMVSCAFVFVLEWNLWVFLSGKPRIDGLQ